MNANKPNSGDPFGLPNQDKYDANAPNRKRWGSDDETDPQFAPLDRSGYGLGSRNLKRFLGAAAQAAEDASKPSRLTLHTKSGAALVVQIAHRDGLWIGLVPFLGEWREFQARSYDALITLLTKTFSQGPTIRPLSEAGRLAVARLCTEGRLEEGLEKYVTDRCPDITPDAINDPNYRGLFDAAAWEIFSLSTPDFPDSAEVRSAMKEHLGNRPASLPLLLAAWRSVKRGLVLGLNQPKQNETESAPRISEADLQKLTDDNVAELYGGVIRERATEERKFRDLLRG
jgi:hypothetical protein